MAQAPSPAGRDRRLHIGIYGRMNAGKSTLLNRLTGQQTAIVSPEAGTTTDPVRRSYEIMELGPVVFIDTAGIDDTGTDLGRQRVEKSRQTLTEIDLAIVLLLSGRPDGQEQELIDRIQANDIPYLVLPRRAKELGTEEILGRIRAALPETIQEIPPFFGDRLRAGDTVILVCPIDSAAPAGRLILPQVQALRAALDVQALALTVQLEKLPDALRLCPAPRLVVTDSQLFKEVAALTPEGVEPTSFSVLLAEQKGDPVVYREGLAAVDRLAAGDKVLIVENCSHQVTCDDIGRTKIPGWLREYTGLQELEFTVIGGRDPLPADLPSYAFAVQCGGCISTRRTIQNRIGALRKAGVPVTNYGMLIRRLRVGRS